MAFTDVLCLQMYYALLVKEYLRRTQEKLERDCLEKDDCERSLKLCNWSSTEVCFYWQEKLE